MSIMERLESRATSGTMGPPRDPVVAAWFGGMASSATGLSITADAAMRSTVVYRCVSLLAETYASLPLQVFLELDNGNKEIDKAHPRYRLLHDRPNRYQTSFEWREMMAGHFALRNRAYSEIVASGGNAVDQLIPLHPDRVRPFRAPDGRLAFEYMPQNGPARIILQSEMHFLHGKTMDLDGLTPLSPLACREAIGLSLAAEEHGARLFGNGTRLGGILKFPQGKSLKDDQARQRLLKSWRDAQSGLRNVGKTAILEDGLEWQELGMTSTDAQFIELRKLQIPEICRIWGIPPHLVADLDRSTNNNIEHQGLEFVRHTIRPGAARWEQAMRRDLFEGDANHCAEFNLDGLMRGDKAAQSAFYASALQNGYKTRNEIRALENDNRSDATGMDDFSVQQNMTMIQFLEALVKSNQQQGAAQQASIRELIAAIAAQPAPAVTVAAPQVTIAEGAIQYNGAPTTIEGATLNMPAPDMSDLHAIGEGITRMLESSAEFQTRQSSLESATRDLAGLVAAPRVGELVRDEHGNPKAVRSTIERRE